MTELRRIVAVLAVGALALAGPAAGTAGAALNITIDSAFFPLNGGILAQDFTASQGTGVVDDAKSVAVHNNRIFTVGQTSSDAGIVAYKTNGLVDTTWGPNDARPVGALVDETIYFARPACVSGVPDFSKITLHVTQALAETPCTDPQPNTVNLVATGAQPVNHTLSRTSNPTVFSFAPTSPTVNDAADTITLPANHEPFTAGEAFRYDTGVWSDGKVAISFPGNAQTNINSLLILPDGKMRLVGSTGSASALDVAVVGLTANGEPDQGFGANAPVPGLVPGKTYFARPTLADPNRVLLYNSAAEAIADPEQDGPGIVDIGDPFASTGAAHTLSPTAGGPFTFNPRALVDPDHPENGPVVSPTTNTIHLGANTLAPGDPLVYDPGTGQSTGRVAFKAGAASEAGMRIAVDPGTGRLAIVGTRNVSSRDDTFVAMLEPTGLPVTAFHEQPADDPATDPGVRAINLGGDDPSGPTNRHDRGVDVAFLQNGNPVALAMKATTVTGEEAWYPVLHAFQAADGADDPTFSGDGDLVLDQNGFAANPDNLPSGGLIEHGGKLWVTGAVRNANDVDAFLTRVDEAGGNIQTRKFDMPGGFVSFYGTPVTRPRDITVVPGTVPTIVVAGSVAGNGTDWAAAGFQDTGGSVASLPFSSAAFPNQARGEYPIVAVAPGGSNWVAVVGGYDKAGGSSDKAVGTARLFLDGTGSGGGSTGCDLAVQVPTLELLFAGSAPVSAQIQVTNVGTQSCSGVVTVESPFAISPGSIPTGELAPGGSFNKTIQVSYRGSRRPDAIAVFKLLAAADTNSQNDRFPVRGVFNYCDLSVRRESGVGFLPSEGSRTLSYNLRNAGTTTCRRVRLGVEGQGRRTGGDEPLTLRPGRSISADVRVAALPRSIRAGAASIVIRGKADGDVNPANDSSPFRLGILTVGDSDARRPGGRVRSFRGSARGGKGKASKRLLRVKRVHVAVLRKGKGCRWLASKRGGFAKRSCSRPLWLAAKGGRRWRLRLTKALPPGRYVLYSRATIGAGFPEAKFSAKDGNRIEFAAR